MGAVGILTDEAAGTPEASDQVDEFLAALALLKGAGIITDEEFEAKMRLVLAKQLEAETS